MKNIFRGFLFSIYFLLGLGLSINAQALVVNSEYFLAQHCQLGETCPIPGNDEGITYYYITSATGTSYHCKVTPDSNVLEFGVYAGKDFVIKRGNGDYRTESGQAFSINIFGEFGNKGEGQIKIRKIEGSGQVTCDKAS